MNFEVLFTFAHPDMSKEQKKEETPFHQRSQQNTLNCIKTISGLLNTHISRSGMFNQKGIDRHTHREGK